MSTSSQRGSMIGPGTTVCGSMAEFPQAPRVLSAGADRLPLLAGADRFVRAALGISGSVDRQGLSAVANLESARSCGLARGSLAADECVNCAAYGVPPRDRRGTGRVVRTRCYRWRIVASTAAAGWGPGASHGGEWR